MEVHQSSRTSSDMRFDMSLSGEVSGGGSYISAPLYFSAPKLLRARSYASSTGEWSALNEASFLLGVPASSNNLVISKIHYHPSDAQGDLAEYVELLNISDQPVSLAGVSFSEGISFAFNDIDTLQPACEPCWWPTRPPSKPPTARAQASSGPSPPGSRTMANG